MSLPRPLQPLFHQFVCIETQEEVRRQTDEQANTRSKPVSQWDRQAAGLTDGYNSSSVCSHNYCAVKESFDVIALDSPIPRHRSLSHRRHKKHIQSPSIIHPIHQSHLNTSSEQAVLSVCLSDLAVGRQEAKQTARVCLPAHAWTVIRRGCLSVHADAYVWK